MNNKFVQNFIGFIFIVETVNSQNIDLSPEILYVHPLAAP
jgi:hypothetical protein